MYPHRTTVATLLFVLSVSAAQAALSGYRCLNFAERAECLEVFLELRHEFKAIEYLYTGGGDVPLRHLLEFRNCRDKAGFIVPMPLYGPTADEYHQVRSWLGRIADEGHRPVPADLDFASLRWLGGDIFYFTLSDSERQRAFAVEWLVRVHVRPALAAIEREISELARWYPAAADVFRKVQSSYEARCLYGFVRENELDAIRAADTGPVLPPYHSADEESVDAPLDLLGQATAGTLSTPD